MSQHKHIQPPDVIILIAAQFDEMDVVTCHAALRDRRLSVVLVSVMPGLVQSIRGITVHPDSYLSQGRQLVSEHKQQMIVLAG
ncbi:MAG: DJ-1/PfpI family protein, partial [Anaerolineae bacterium]